MNEPHLNSSDPAEPLWDIHRYNNVLGKGSLRSAERELDRAGVLPAPLRVRDIRIDGAALKPQVSESLLAEATRSRTPSLVLQTQRGEDGKWVMMVNDGRLGRRWRFCASEVGAQDLRDFLALVAESYDRHLLIWPASSALDATWELCRAQGGMDVPLGEHRARLALTAYPEGASSNAGVTLHPLPQAIHQRTRPNTCNSLILTDWRQRAFTSFAK